MDLKLETGVGTPSIPLPLSPVLEVLPKPTLTLFVKKPFLFWREKNFRKKICERLLLFCTLYTILYISYLQEMVRSSNGIQRAGQYQERLT